MASWEKDKIEKQKILKSEIKIPTLNSTCFLLKLKSSYSVDDLSAWKIKEDIKAQEHFSIANRTVIKPFIECSKISSISSDDINMENTPFPNDSYQNASQYKLFVNHQSFLLPNVGKNFSIPFDFNQKSLSRLSQGNLNTPSTSKFLNNSDQRVELSVKSNSIQCNSESEPLLFVPKKTGYNKVEKKIALILQKFRLLRINNSKKLKEKVF